MGDAADDMAGDGVQYANTDEAMAEIEKANELIAKLNQLEPKPDTKMRRFIGYRPNPPAEYLEKGTAAPPNEPQYEGVVFTDGSVALRWKTEFKSTSVWPNYNDFYHVHGHPEYGTIIEWLDD